METGVRLRQICSLNLSRWTVIILSSVSGLVIMIQNLRDTSNVYIQRKLRKIEWNKITDLYNCDLF